MSDNVNITPGSGVVVTSEQMSGDSSQCQLFKLAISTAGVRTLIPADAANGLDVDVTRVGGNVTVVQATAANLKVDASGVPVPVTDNAGSLTVDAPAGTPVFVRLSNGTIAVDTVPVSGTVTVTQGTAAATNAPWTAKITDGVTAAAVDAGTGALKVFMAGGTSGGGTSLADNSAFTQGSSGVTPIGGEFNDSPSNPSSGQAAAARITQLRALHINIRKNDGTELGIAATPLRTDPTGTTAQPVTQSVADWTVNLTKLAGVAITPAAPIPVTLGGRAQTRVTKSVALTASQTGTTIWTPTAGKTLYIRNVIIALSVGGTLTVFDSTNAAANLLTDGTMPVGVAILHFSEPWASAAINNVLKFTTGTGITGTITVHGFEI